MDKTRRIPNAGLENENAFSETLITDPGLADKQKPVPAADSAGTKSTPESSPESSAAKQRPWVGKIMGHFKLLRLIGEGAMGLVIQAEDIHLKRIVALKVLRKQLADGEKGKNAVEQFLREARAAAAIEHPNIVRVYEIDQHAGWWYIAMEMINGNSLQEILKVVGSLPPSRACPIIADVAIGLQAAHELGMIHRDIKPSNILVTRNGHGKISDFGLVRVDDPDDPFDAFAHQSVGTPLYIAPEMIRHEPLSSAVDIYSLGATLYHALTGRPPFDAEKMNDILKLHLNADPPDLQQALPGCSPSLSALIQRMMAKNPYARPTAPEVTAILHAESIATLPDSQAAPGPAGSTWQAIFEKSRTPMPPLTDHAAAASPPRQQGLSLAKLRAPWRVLLATTILLVLGGMAFWLYTARNQPGEDRRLVAGLFPQAPQSYGSGNTQKTPPPSNLTSDIPAFSWKGKVDASTFRFIAGKKGLHFYSIDDKRAVLIRADQFIGYESAEQALKDGKLPAP